MKLLVLFCLLVGCYAKSSILEYTSIIPGNGYSYSAPSLYSSHSLLHSLAVSPLTHTIEQIPIVGVEKTQYHAQDELGQATYGHSEPLQTHNAVQDAHGNKIGSYSYVAPDGQVISTSYIADALGYRVTSNAVPVESAEIVAARAAHLQEVEVTKHRTRRGLASFYRTPLTYHTPRLAYRAPIFTKTRLFSTPYSHKYY